VIQDSLALFNESLVKSDWDTFINSCSLVSALIDIFPEFSESFQSMIVPLIKIVSEKVDAVRKTAAVCLAKLAKNEENSKVMRANHGHEVLVSLGGVFGK
jgi:vesicle coat complex subunit